MVALRVLNLKRSFVLCIFVFITLFLEDVKSHGFLQSPRSRNYVASVDGVWFGGDSSTPAAESCPHCLNIGGTLGLCGSVDGRDYVYPPSSDGGVLPFTPQATYVKNGMIDIEVKLTAHHKGHFEYRICPLEPNEIPTQACFDSHPLEFVQDNLYGAVKDSNYPARAYIPRYSLPTLVYSSDGLYGSIYSHKFKLPENLVSDRALLQWHYITANSCSPPGYDQYNFPSNFADEPLAVCDHIPEDGLGTPEQFWNCAEICITEDGTPCSGSVNPQPPSLSPPTSGDDETSTPGNDDTTAPGNDDTMPCCTNASKTLESLLFSIMKRDPRKNIFIKS